MALRTAGVRYCQRTPPPPEAGTRFFSSSAPDFWTTIDSSSSRLPNKNQCRFFFGVGEGVPVSGEGVDGVSLRSVGEGEGEACLGVSSSSAGVGLAPGPGCLRAVDSGVPAELGCLSGDGAGLGVGFGVSVGLGTISICWRLFKKSSRKRFSSSDCWVMPWFDPRINSKSKSKTGTFSLRTRELRLPGLQNSNRGSFRVSGQKNYRIQRSGAGLCATGDSPNSLEAVVSIV